MRRFMRFEKLRAAAFAAVCLPILAATLSAQVKVGIVDFQEALLATADMQKQASGLEQKYKPQQERLEELSKELQAIQAKLGGVSGADALQLQAEGQSKERDAQRLSEDLQADIDFDRNQILEGGAMRMRAVLDELRAAKGLDLLLDVSSALSFNSALELTSEATAAYDKKHPAQ